MKSSSSRSAFTLVQLLCSICIIAVLTAVLLPALQSARETSRQMMCVDNLRKLYVAWNTYSLDQNGGVVMPAYSNGLTWNTLLNTTVLPADTLLKPNPYNCPANPLKITPHSSANYAYNASLGNMNDALPNPPYTYSTRMASLDQLPKTLLFADAGLRVGYPTEAANFSFSSIDEESGKGPGYLHRKRANFLFGDGHVQAVTQAEALDGFEKKTILIRRDNLPPGIPYW